MHITAHHEELIVWAERLKLIDMNLLGLLDELYWSAFEAGFDAAVDGLRPAEIPAQHVDRLG